MVLHVAVAEVEEDSVAEVEEEDSLGEAVEEDSLEEEGEGEE